MRLPFLIALLLTISTFDTEACFILFARDGNRVLVANHEDWTAHDGAMRLIPPAAGRYGSIIFTFSSEGWAQGGMNEKGLVVELMWLEGSKFPAADHRPALNVLQWLQYQLDNHASIDEVIASDKTIRITAEGTPLHYLVADSSGRTATIEFLHGKMVVHQGASLDFAVLTNSVYSESVSQTKEIIQENRAINLADNSLRRFAQTCSMIQQFKSSGQQALDYSFSILNKVSQGGYTKWSIVYDITARQIHFITSENKNRRTVAFNDFSFDCTAPSLTIDMNDQGSGQIAKNFKNLSFDLNKNLVEVSVKQSSSLINIPAAAVLETVSFYRKTSCTTVKN